MGGGELRSLRVGVFVSGRIDIGICDVSTIGREIVSFCSRLHGVCEKLVSFATTDKDNSFLFLRLLSAVLHHHSQFLVFPPILLAKVAVGLCAALGV